MTDDLLPAELALPAGAPVPIPEDELDRVAQGERLPLAELADKSEAEWVMRRLAGLLRFIDAQRAQRDAWKERVDDWYAETAGPAERRALYLEDTLKRFAVAERLANPRAATQKVPSGEVWTRSDKTPRVVIDNEDQVLTWLKDTIIDVGLFDTIVRTSYDVRVSELAKVVEVVEREVPPPPEWEGNVPADYDERELVVLYGGERVPGVHAEAPKITSGVRPAVGIPALPE